MRQFFIATWRAGIRSRGFHAALLLGLLLVAAAYLGAAFSPRQPKTVSLDLGLSGLRLVLVIMALLWVQELVATEMDRGRAGFFLAYPVPRESILLGRFFGVLTMLAATTLALGLLLLATVLGVQPNYAQQFPVSLGLPYWGSLVGVWLDVAVVTAFAFLVASFATIPMLPLATGVCFAIAGRGLGPVLDYLSSGAEGDRDLVATFGPLLANIRWVLPDLSRLDWRISSLYGIEIPLSSIVWSVGMALGYIVLSLTLAAFLYRRRQFE
jgi:Cu-processing system permease protein